MRRCSIVLFNLIMCFSLFSNVFASEEIMNDGRIEFDIFSTEDMETANYETDDPLPGVKLELYYNYNDEWCDVRELELFSNTNLALESDENGKIILSNVPYGLYQYKIAYIPDGYVQDFSSKIIQVYNANKNVYEDIFLLQDIKMSEEITIIEEEQTSEELPKEEIPIETETYEEPEINKEEIEVPVKVEKEEKKIENIKVNNIAENLYKVNEEESTDISQKETEVMKQISQKLTEITNKKKVDTISNFKKVRITDTIKSAVTTMDSTMHYLRKMSVSTNDDKVDEKKKKIRLHRINRVILTNEK